MVSCRLRIHTWYEPKCFGCVQVVVWYSVRVWIIVPWINEYQVTVDTIKREIIRDADDVADNGGLLNSVNRSATDTNYLVFKGVRLDIDWRLDKDVPIELLPKACGLYAEIHWASMGVRIGESINIRARHQEGRSWMRQMHAGTAKASELRRDNVFCQAVKRDGVAGFGHCLISTDPVLASERLRLEIERYLFIWVADHPIYQDFNFQQGYQNTLRESRLEDLEARVRAS